MTDPPTAPIPVAGARTLALAPPDGEILTRATGVELLGEVPGSGYRQPPALARRSDGQVVQLTPLLHEVMVAVDGHRSLAEVAAAVSASVGRLVAPDDVRQLADGSLRPLGLLRRADGSEPELRRSSPLLALRFKRVVSDPAVTRRLTAPFAVLFSPLVVVPVVLAFGVVAGWVLFSQGLAAATAQAFANPALFLTVVAVTVLSAGFHEFGHAAAARYGGSTPGAMGFGVYLFWPAFYTDVTDSYRLGRAGRVRTDLGGLYFNALVVLLSFAVWWVTGWHAVLLIVATQVLQMIRQLAPLLRFDGYHVLADLTGVPDLYRRIRPVLSGLLPGRWHQPEATALKTWARVVVVLWILVVVPLMAVSTLLMVLSLPRLLGTAWLSVQTQAARLGEAFGDGDVLEVLARLLGLVAVVVPVLGIGLVVVRLVRRTALGVWRRTEGRPARRWTAGLLAAALVGGLAWAWWPADDRYRPVRAWEGGTVLDAVPAASSTALEAGSRGAATTIWPEDAGPPPTVDQPVLAMVLAPATEAPGEGSGDRTAERGDTDGAGSGLGGRVGVGADAAPTWVFPFDRPLPPGEGDNQALAVNTRDGSVAYDVSFALVWADEDAVLDRNEAFVAASCRDCRAVAVAFQVVLVVGSVDVVVPQNLSTAVNYACLQCVTYALATQLVVTLPGPLSDAGTQELAAIWAELQEFGEQIEGVPLAELRDRLTDFEARILTVVQKDPAAQPGGTAPTDAGGPIGGGSPVSSTAARSSASSAGDTGVGSGPATTGATPSSGAASTTGTAGPTGTSTAADTTAAADSMEAAGSSAAASSPSG
jgi:putative peptide zinc metalloprotease protein